MKMNILTGLLERHENLKNDFSIYMNEFDVTMVNLQKRNSSTLLQEIWNEMIGE